MVRKAAAGLLIGTCAAVLVLALTDLEAFRTVELKTYDWRLSRTADPSTARKDIALVEIDEYSLRNLQQHAGQVAVAAGRPRQPYRLSEPRQAEADCLRRSVRRRGLARWIPIWGRYMVWCGVGQGARQTRSRRPETSFSLPTRRLSATPRRSRRCRIRDIASTRPESSSDKWYFPQRGRCRARRRR